jgi:hypothetical protein
MGGGFGGFGGGGLRGPTVKIMLGIFRFYF